MARTRIDVLPFDRDVRAARRGAFIGAALGLLSFLVVLLRHGGSSRELIGGMLMCLAGGATFGALVPLGPATRYASARPESKRRLVVLLLCIAVAGLGAVVLGAFVAGITGDR